MKRRILLLTDSLSLPRNLPESVSYEETYPYILSQDGHLVVSHARGYAVITDLKQQVSYYKGFNPDVVVLQCGIVDLAPRPFGRLEELFFQQNNFWKCVRYGMEKVFTRELIRKVRKKRFTSLSRYRSTCRAIKEFFPLSQVCAIGILPASEDYEKRVQGMVRRIEEYNVVLKEVFGDNYVDMEKIPWDGIMSDHHHLNVIGHAYVYEMLNKKIESL